jgi:hypothetical protein
MFSVADAVYVLEGPFPQLPDTAQRPIEPALWQRQGLIVPDRTDLGRDSNRCAPIREVLRHNSLGRSRGRENSPAGLRRHLRSNVSCHLPSVEPNVAALADEYNRSPVR